MNGELIEGVKVMRTFVLGAGASLHVGYPLVKELGPKLIEWAGKNRRPQQLYWVDEQELREIFPSLDDIEAIITELQYPAQGSPIDGLPGWKRASILAGIRNALCEFFDSIRANDAFLYRQFAREIAHPGDVILSLNYDVSLERELRRAGKWEISDGYGFDLGVRGVGRSPTRLLKLHGSTNWMDSIFDGLRGNRFQMGGGDSLGARPVILPKEFEFLEYPGTLDPQFKGGGMDRAGSMILPGRRKQFHVSTSINPREREQFWTLLWTQAENAVKQANGIVVVGYSFAAADEDARNLVFNTSNKDVLLTICCGQDTDRVGNEFARAGFSRICTDAKRFEDWLATQSTTHGASVADSLEVSW
jgi:hypothetical protein